MTRTTTPASRRAGIAAFAALAAAGALAGCVAGTAEAEEEPVATTPAAETAPPTSASSPAATAEADDSVYADGTYSADGSYQSPNGAESITVTVTIEDDVVTAVSVDGHASGGNAAQYQARFASGIAAEVVGKSLDEVEVSRVAGSSLTSGGFNAAIDAIQAQAAA